MKGLDLSERLRNLIWKTNFYCSRLPRFHFEWKIIWIEIAEKFSNFSFCTSRCSFPRSLLINGSWLTCYFEESDLKRVFLHLTKIGSENFRPKPPFKWVSSRKLKFLSHFCLKSSSSYFNASLTWKNSNDYRTQHQNVPNGETAARNHTRSLFALIRLDSTLAQRSTKENYVIWLTKIQNFSLSLSLSVFKEL